MMGLYYVSNSIKSLVITFEYDIFYRTLKLSGTELILTPGF